MRKFLSVFLTVSLLISLSGCNGGEPSASSAADTTTTTAGTTIKAPEPGSPDEEISSVPEASEETTATTTTTENTTTTSATTTAKQEVTTTTGSTVPVETTTSATSTTADTTVPKEEAPLSQTVYEAEDAKLSGTLRICDGKDFSGGKAVENFGGKTDYLTFDITVSADGMYDITFVSSGIGSYKENNLIIDGTPIGVFKSEKDVLSENTVPSISLTKGSHKIKITPSWGWIKLDCIKVIKAEGISDEIYKVSDTLINKNSTPRTRSLFSYLCDSYGKYVLSGQVCDDGYNGKEITAIRKVTGKTPAILGLDFMDYTPSRTALGARSHAVDKAIEFSNKGGIVTFCWHWNAPTEYLKDGNDSDNGNPRWWGGFYSRNSTFDIAKVMNGTDKTGKELIDRDIEEIAKQLKRLADADVPVLWRPLHEASGGWFWWGAKGADAYKKLWIYLYEELTYKYGCNNLIWVFNGQNDSWYPGDEYVDIVGEDIYPGERVYAPQTAKFKEAAQYSDSNKIVALTENGCIFDIDQAVATNTMWAWFCTWGGEFASYGTEYSEKFTEKSIIKKAYDSKYVITLDELPKY
ncbi:MAG: beta-mannanase [Ruminiclostridium sp.]|nr:beta-mannanase [Ruminiclostridium sp.]